MEKKQKALSIEIAVSEIEEWVFITVKDNGQGIAETELPFVFDRFYRVEKSRTNITGGSGLGLPIVKQIIERHGGKVMIESIVNEGTKVTILLRKYEGEAFYDYS
ncbi:sensor histidine kinase [Enterococcus rivorum]|uniref:sensor histidine kinase n=1 Tax=Enterococcus rivorum TaxID=762845 RepID=UPI003636FAD6